MIRAVIVMNTLGKPRLVRFYEFQPPEKQKELIRSIYGVLSSRADNVSNFIKTDAIFGEDTRLVYKHLATMYFVFVYDSSENELAMLDLIQVFVETLERCFKNVCELDLVYNFSKLHTILDEMIFAGQVVGTSSEEVVKAVEEIARNPLSLLTLSHYLAPLSLSLSSTRAYTGEVCFVVFGAKANNLHLRTPVCGKNFPVMEISATESNSEQKFV